MYNHIYYDLVNILVGFRSLGKLIHGLTTRADNSHAVSELIILLIQDKVSFLACYRIKPHAPPVRYTKPSIILNFNLAIVVLR